MLGLHADGATHTPRKSQLLLAVCREHRTTISMAAGTNNTILNSMRRAYFASKPVSLRMQQADSVLCLSRRYCSYQISGSTSLPWHDGARYWVATGQYNASRICGLCAAFHGTQESGSPIPTSVQYAQSGSQTVHTASVCDSPALTS